MYFNVVLLLIEMTKVFDLANIIGADPDTKEGRLPKEICSQIEGLVGTMPIDLKYSIYYEHDGQDGKRARIKYNLSDRQINSLRKIVESSPHTMTPRIRIHVDHIPSWSLGYAPYPVDEEKINPSALGTFSYDNECYFFTIDRELTLSVENIHRENNPYSYGIRCHCYHVDGLRIQLDQMITALKFNDHPVYLRGGYIGDAVSLRHWSDKEPQPSTLCLGKPQIWIETYKLFIASRSKWVEQRKARIEGLEKNRMDACREAGKALAKEIYCIFCKLGKRD